MEKNKIYKEAQYILNQLNELDRKYSHELTNEVWNHLQHIRFTAEEIQSQSQNYVYQPEAEGERDRP